MKFFWREIFREIISWNIYEIFQKSHDDFFGQYTHLFNIFHMSNITFRCGAVVAAGRVLSLYIIFGFLARHFSVSPEDPSVHSLLWCLMIVQCLRSDISNLGHYNRFCYLLTCGTFVPISIFSTFFSRFRVTRKPCCRKETAWCRSRCFWFKVRRQHSLQV